MFLSILHRMILWELAKVFFISLLGITGILLMAGIVAEATQQGLGPTQVLYIIPLLIPSTLPYTIPTTTLFASSVVYGRLAHDNEILAIKAAGVNILKVIRPALLLGLVMSVATMSLYYRIIPYTHGLMRSMFLKDVEEVLYGMLRKNLRINQPNLSYAMWVKGVQGRTLLISLFKRRDANGHWDVIAYSREAELHVDQARRQVLVHMRNGSVIYEGGAHAYFEDKTWPVPLPDLFGDDRPEAAARPELAGDAEHSAANWNSATRKSKPRSGAGDCAHEPESAAPRPAQASFQPGTGKPGYPREHPVHRGRDADAAGALVRLPLLRPGRLPGGHLVQPKRLPQLVHHLLFAHRLRLLPVDALRHQHGQGR